MGTLDNRSFEVAGKAYPLVQVADMTFREQRALKRYSGGMSLAKLEESLQEIDPDAWFALLLVSLERAEPRTNGHEDRLMGENLLDIAAALARGAESAEGDEGAEGDPPADAPEGAPADGN